MADFCRFVLETTGITLKLIFSLYSQRAGFFLRSNLMAWVTCALFLIKCVFLLCSVWGMTFILHHASPQFVETPSTGSVSLFLPSSHPEKAFSCLHEAQSEVTTARLECHHDGLLVPLFPLSAPDMIGEGVGKFPDLFRFLLFFQNKNPLISFCQSSSKPPPRK